jgi:hypothetical protein
MPLDLRSPAVTQPLSYPGSDEADMQMVSEVRQQTGPLVELGTTGLKRASGYVDEEFLPALRGRKAIQVYREMDDNDAIIGALMFAVSNLIKEVDWQVVPAGKSTADAGAARLLESCMDDMSHSWSDFIQEALSALVYGWSWHEIVWKQRRGPWQREGKYRSKYSDNLIGIRKLPIRAQETWQRWIFDDSGDVRGMVQLAPPNYKTTTLPIERSLLFRYGSYKNNPEGKSMLRRAYRSWFYKKRFEEFEAIGVERDLAGLPMVRVPAAWLKARPGTDQYKQVQAYQKLVRSIRRNEQEGIVFPRSIDRDSKMDEFDFELLNGGGQRQFPTDSIITRLETRMLMTVLMDWIIVGHQTTGTYNMHVDKTGVAKTALNAITHNMLADTLNRHLVPRLFAINGWKPSALPMLVPDDVEAPDLTQLAQFMGATAGIGFNWGPDLDLEKWMRRKAGMPAVGVSDEPKRRREGRQAEELRMVQTQTELLSAKSQLAQMMAQQRLQAEGIDPETMAQGQEAQQGQEQHDASMAQSNAQTQSTLMQAYTTNGSSSNPQGGRPAGTPNRNGKRGTGTPKRAA